MSHQPGARLEAGKLALYCPEPGFDHSTAGKVMRLIRYLGDIHAGDHVIEGRKYRVGFPCSAWLCARADGATIERLGADGKLKAEKVGPFVSKWLIPLGDPPIGEVDYDAQLLLTHEPAKV